MLDGIRDGGRNGTCGDPAGGEAALPLAPGAAQPVVGGEATAHVLLGSPRLSVAGRWRKNKALSDSMNEACDLVQLPWLLRKAIGLLNVIELEETEEYFRTVLKAGGILDVVEKYPWSGEAVPHPRRDKRSGRHTGFVKRTAAGPCIVCTWDDPFAGECSDTFELSPCGTRLTEHTEMRLTGSVRSTIVKYKTVFERVGSIQAISPAGRS